MFGIRACNEGNGRRDQVRSLGWVRHTLLGSVIANCPRRMGMFLICLKFDSMFYNIWWCVMRHLGRRWLSIQRWRRNLGTLIKLARASHNTIEKHGNRESHNIERIPQHKLTECRRAFKSSTSPRLWPNLEHSRSMSPTCLWMRCAWKMIFFFITECVQL